MPPNKQSTLLQSQIKDIVITRLTTQLCLNYNELQVIRDENIELKTKLTEVYRRMILYHSSTTTNNTRLPSDSNKPLSSRSPRQYNSTSSTSRRDNHNKELLSSHSAKKYRASIIAINSMRNNTVMSKNNLSRNYDPYPYDLIGGNGGEAKTESLLMTGNDRINMSSKYLSNTSSNAFLCNGSPQRNIGGYCQYRNANANAYGMGNGNGGKLTKAKTVFMSPNCSSDMGRKMKIMKKFNTMQKIETKNVIKVSIKKQISPKKDIGRWRQKDIGNECYTAREKNVYKENYGSAYSNGNGSCCYYKERGFNSHRNSNIV